MKYLVGEWGDLGGDFRKQFVSEILIKKFSLALDWMDIPADWKQDPISSLKAHSLWTGVWVSPDVSQMLIPVWPQMTVEVRESGVIDVLLKQQGVWWFRCFLREALRDAIVHHAPQLDTHSFAYIIGSDASAELGASVAIQLGFRHLIVVTSNSDEGQDLVERINKKYFGLDLSTIPGSQITLQPSNGSLLINTLGANSQEPVVTDLLYLNFLKKEGLVIDLPYPGGLQQLTEEAIQLGIRHITGSEVIGRRDFLFLKSLMNEDFRLSQEDFLREWNSRL